MNQEQGQINVPQDQLLLQWLDNSFHRLIIALERYEKFLYQDYSNKDLIDSTAIGTDRDFHTESDEDSIEESYISEVENQCKLLYIQSKGHKDTTISFFIKDLLKWYGGRSSIENFDVIDKYAFLILEAITRKPQSKRELGEMFSKYAVRTKPFSELSLEEQEEAIHSTLEVLIKVQHEQTHSLGKMEIASEEEIYTSHVRGSLENGYKRLYAAMVSGYDESLPVMMLCSITKQYVPELNTLCETLNTENAEKLIQNRLNGNSKGLGTSENEFDSKERTITEDKTSQNNLSEDAVESIDSKPLNEIEELLESSIESCSSKFKTLENPQNIE